MKVWIQPVLAVVVIVLIWTTVTESSRHSKSSHDHHRLESRETFDWKKDGKQDSTNRRKWKSSAANMELDEAEMMHAKRLYLKALRKELHEVIRTAIKGHQTGGITLKRDITTTIQKRFFNDLATGLSKAFTFVSNIINAVVNRMSANSKLGSAFTRLTTNIGVMVQAIDEFFDWAQWPLNFFNVGLAIFKVETTIKKCEAAITEIIPAAGECVANIDEFFKDLDKIFKDGVPADRRANIMHEIYEQKRSKNNCN